VKVFGCCLGKSSVSLSFKNAICYLYHGRLFRNAGEYSFAAQGPDRSFYAWLSFGSKASSRTRGSSESTALRAVEEERFCCKTKTRLNYFLEAGSVLGKSCEISQLLPHRNTISSMVDDVYSVHRKQLVDICASIRSFAITIDFWTESYTGVGYGGITLHCVHPQAGLTTFVLCCQLYDMSSSAR
jgi:hypothetical protein